MLKQVCKAPVDKQKKEERRKKKQRSEKAKTKNQKRSDEEMKAAVMGGVTLPPCAEPERGEKTSTLAVALISAHLNQSAAVVACTVAGAACRIGLG